MFLFLWKQQALQVCVRLHIQRPFEIGCAGSLKDGSDGISGTLAALCNAPLADPLAVKPEDLTILGHMMTSLNRFVQKTTARDSIIRVALPAGKGGSPKTEQWLSPPGLGALRGRNIHYISKIFIKFIKL